MRHCQCGDTGDEFVRNGGYPVREVPDLTVAIDRPGVNGCRITPNVYTSTQELDALVKELGKETFIVKISPINV